MAEDDDKELFKGFTNKMAVLCASITLVIIFIGVSLYTTNQHMSKLLSDINKNYKVLNISMDKRYKTVPKLVKITQNQMVDDINIFSGINSAQASYRAANTPIKKMEANTQIDQETGSLISSINVKHPKMAKKRKVKMLVNKLNNSDAVINSQQLKYNISVEKYNKALKNPATFLFVKILGYKPINNTIAMS